MPKLVKLYIQSVAIGFALSAGFVALLLMSNVASVGGLIIGAGAMGAVAVAMLVVFFGILFSGVQFAIRIMMMAEDQGGPRGGLRQQLVPIRVHAESRKRQTRR
ncbi:hypothetical protein HOY34_08890 [Xinfangfangia sp. D13-10-4-6]|uniref:hypothetical protein n=1 Tax=Pseudogemmobacter hezensis TaxID=2737662 RepID=UPI001557BC7F|nr:hypothetical protein [Pseudogemmobacter hezensis]NPD15313.1 hypothetical protein [Pseudogemmobacter hezensis]